MTTQQVREMAEKLDKETFLSWKAHPVTELLLKWAESKREELKESWASGSFSAAFTTEMLVKNAAATGACSILADIINVDYVDVQGE